MRSTQAFRFARVPTNEIEARLASEIGRVVNVSATGALLRTHAPFLVGRSCPLFMNLPSSPISLTVRVMRTEHVPADDTTGGEYLVGVMFTEFSSPARQAIAKLCGASFTRHE
jgi:hypothetical protein